MPVQAIPDNFPRVSPFLSVSDVEGMTTFLIEVFDAKETQRISMPDGTARHIEVQIGDSVIMIGPAGSDSEPMSSMLYIYTADTDATYEKALNAGATSVMEPGDQFYGDRNAGVKGPFGNYWWIATRVEDVSKEEMDRRAAAAQSN